MNADIRINFGPKPEIRRRAFSSSRKEWLRNLENGTRTSTSQR